jgi:8-oxo-dGTP diphosphatase
MTALRTAGIAVLRPSDKASRPVVSTSLLTEGSSVSSPPTREHVAAESRLPRVGSAVMVTNGEAVLLGVRDKEPNRGMWVLPGGKIEPFESIQDAARREILEETGLRVRIVRQLGVYEILKPPDEHRLIVFSAAEVIGGELAAASDVSEVRFWKRRELQSLRLTELTRTVLRDAGWLQDERREAA